MTQQLIELRKAIKEKKPIFIRQDNPKRKKLSYKWRKPKGIHSKIRHHFKGRRKMPSPGYKSPAAVRGFHSSGLKIVYVFTPTDVAPPVDDAPPVEAFPPVPCELVATHSANMPFDRQDVIPDTMLPLPYVMVHGCSNPIA